MKLTAVAVSRPVTTFMVFLAVLVLGCVAYTRLPIQLLPDITLPVIGIFAASDRSTEDNLEEVTKKIEGIVAEMPRVKSIRSNTRASQVWIQVEFAYGTDIQYAFVDLEERLASFRNSLPDRRTRVNAFPFSTADFQSSYMFLSVRGKGDAESLFKTAADKVETSLKAINGVSNVELRGIKRESVEVDIRPDLLSAYKLDFGSVIGRVQAAASEDTYLGRLRVPGETHYVRVSDRVKTVDELAEIVVDGKGIVRLKDVSSIAMGETIDRWVSRSDGKNSVNIRMERESDKNLIELARETRKRVEEINGTLPPGVELVIDEDLAKYVEDAISDVKSLAVSGALMALLVPLVFFRSLRVSLIIFMSVPVCLVSVFNLFLAAGMSINIFSIVGLAIGVGMLVDNSIVVVENTFRLYNEGASPLEAARNGGSEVGRGLLAATLTTAVVFVPLAFLDGQFKVIVKEPTLALVFPLLLSLLVALTIVPVFTWLVLRTKRRRADRESTRPSLMIRGYGWVLKGALRHRARVIFLIFATVSFTWLESCQRIRETSSSQQANSEYLGVYFQAPRGSNLSEVNRIAEAIEDRLAKHPNLEGFTVSFNKDGGNMDLRLKPRKEREKKESWQEIRGTIVDFIGPIAGAEVSLQRFDQPLATPVLNFGQEGFLELKGLDLETVNAHAERLIDALRAHPEITNAKVKEQREDPLYLARVDREKTRMFDIKAETLGRYVSATRSSGTISSLQLINGDERTDVAFTISEASEGTVDSVKALSVFSPGYGSIPLGDLTRFQASQSNSVIRRRDRQSSREVAYYFKPTTNTSVLKDDIKEIIARLPNPGGVSVEVAGEAKQVDERQNQFLFMVLAGTLLVYVVMAAVFESYWVPFTIIATNPLMLIGIVWALDFTGLPMDDLAAFGVILLIGVAVNNGIVMMDRALSLQRSGVSRTRAVFEASITRLRPILMTYLTTVIGLLPMGMYGEEGDQWRPVAVVIIGGLSSATILTLVVLPCFYLIGDDFVRWARQPFLNFLKVCFEVFDAATNLTLHPVKVFRREIPLAPSFWPFAGAVIMVVVEHLRTPLKLLVRLPADAVYTARLLAGFPPPRGAAGAGRVARMISAAGLWLAGWGLAIVRFPGRLLRWLTGRFRRRQASGPGGGVAAVEPAAPPVAEPAPGTPPAIALKNIQVIFPPTGLRAVQARLPERFRAGRSFEDFGVRALHGIDLRMETGLFGLLGPNGAGKTTLLRCIAGLLEPTRGSVRLFGVSHREAPRQLASLIGYLPQTHGHYDWMTLYDYLSYFATHTALTVQKARALEAPGGLLQGRLEALARLEDPGTRHEAVVGAIEEVNLGHVTNQRIGSFSGGMRQRAGIARILLQSPPILIVDEPTAGLDPVERMNVRLLLARLAERRLVIFSTHIVEDLEQSCREIAILDRGRLVYHGSPAALREEWTGKIWDVLTSDEENPERLREDLVGARGRILLEIVRDQRHGFRFVTSSPPRRGSVRVTPSLEDALLATLGNGEAVLRTGGQKR